MENKIDKIITIDDGTRYMVIDQGNYDGKCYFLTSRLDTEGNLTEKFSIVEEVVGNGERLITDVKDTALLKALATYFNERALRGE